MSVDDLIGDVFRQLRASGEAKDTLVFFLSDNGYMWGEHNRLGKTDPYIPGIRVPLMVRWPGHLDEGVRDDRLVANVDLAPTILEAAGVEPQHLLDGRSLLAPEEREVLLVEYGWGDRRQNHWASLVTKEYQYIEYYEPGTETTVHGPLVTREYYDLRHDPYQLVNLFRDGRPGNDPDLTPLTTTLERLKACSGAACL